jgi:hypothetical protein
MKKIATFLALILLASSAYGQIGRYCSEDVTLRSVKGDELSWTEGDNNSQNVIDMCNELDGFEALLLTEEAGDHETCNTGDYFIFANSTTNTIRVCQNGSIDSIAVGSGTGETNTGSNLGGGLANFNSKSGSDLRFNSFSSSNFSLSSNLLSLLPSRDESLTGDMDIGSGVLQLPNSTTAPGTCDVGDVYFDTDATSGQKILGCETANNWTPQGSSGTGAFSDSGDPVALNTTTKEVEIGPTLAGSAKLTIHGDADEPQLLIQANSTQTNAVVIIENSAGVNKFTFNVDGSVLWDTELTKEMFTIKGGYDVSGFENTYDFGICDQDDTDRCIGMFFGTDEEELGFGGHDIAGNWCTIIKGSAETGYFSLVNDVTCGDGTGAAPGMSGQTNPANTAVIYPDKNNKNVGIGGSAQRLELYAGTSGDGGQGLAITTSQDGMSGTSLEIRSASANPTSAAPTNKARIWYDDTNKMLEYVGDLDTTPYQVLANRNNATPSGDWTPTGTWNLESATASVSTAIANDNDTSVASTAFVQQELANDITFALLAGRSGGQTIVGGSGSGDDLTFETTSNVTKGSYIFSELDCSSGQQHLTADASGAISCDSDTEIKEISIKNPGTSNSGDHQLMFSSDVTVVRVACSTDTGTATIQFDERVSTTPNTSGTDVMNSALVCDNDQETTTSFANSSIAARQPMNLDIDAVASSPTQLRIFIEYAN